MNWKQIPGTNTQIADAPVTNRQWLQYIQESGYSPKPEDHDGDYLKYGFPPEDQLDTPVTWISWIQADQFCKHYGWRLPTFDELKSEPVTEPWEWIGDGHYSCRGGYYLDLVQFVRCTFRFFYTPTYCDLFIGFRPAQDITPQQVFPTQSPLESLIPWVGGVRPAHDIGHQQASPTQPPLPWVGKLRHDRSEGIDWGLIRDEEGTLICVVNPPKDADLDEHRKNGTDPTQARVDALLQHQAAIDPSMVLVPRDLLEKWIEQSFAVHEALVAIVSKADDK